MRNSTRCTVILALLTVPAVLLAQSSGGAKGAASRGAAPARSAGTAAKSGAAPAKTTVINRAPRRASTPATRNAAASGARLPAWGVPDADALVQRVFTRIVAQDRPGAVPIREYDRRFVGRSATAEAVRKFSGRPVELAPSAFQAVEDGWADAPKLDIPPCIGPGCPAPVNSIWLAITRLERGAAPHELYVWYTTSFAAESPSGPTQATYAFCERWLRLSSGWKYDGFVRVSSSSDKG